MSILQKIIHIQCLEYISNSFSEFSKGLSTDYPKECKSFEDKFKFVKDYLNYIIEIMASNDKQFYTNGYHNAFKKLISHSSELSYRYCVLYEDDPWLRKFIIDSEYAFNYCINVKDDFEVRKHITESKDVLNYMRHHTTKTEGLSPSYMKESIIKNITESGHALDYHLLLNPPEYKNPIKHIDHDIKKHISDLDAVYYCYLIEDDSEVKNNIGNPYATNKYCALVKNDKDLVYKTFKGRGVSHPALLYCLLIEDDPKIRKKITSAKDALYYCVINNETNDKMLKHINNDALYKARYHEYFNTGIDWRNDLTPSVLHEVLEKGINVNLNLYVYDLKFNRNIIYSSFYHYYDENTGEKVYTNLKYQLSGY